VGWTKWFLHTSVTDEMAEIELKENKLDAHLLLIDDVAWSSNCGGIVP
jgi:hypothetical protein